MAGSLLSNLFTRGAEKVDRAVGWSNLPTPLAVPVLIGLRQRLRESNLFDTGRGPLDHPAPDGNGNGNHMTARTLDGTYNDLDDPLMGSLGQPLRPQRPARGTPTPSIADALLEPNPRLVSRRLLTRDAFQPATTLNLLAAAWIQFEVHDWFSHGDNDPDEPWEIPLDDGRPLARSTRCRSSARGPIPAPTPAGPPTYVTADTHWWDGSQIYGSDPDFADGAAHAASTASCGSTSCGLPPRDLEQHIDLGRRGRQLLGRAGAAALAVHARAQRDLRPPARGVPAADRPGALRQGAAGQRRADGQDPHGRLDAGDHRPPDHRARACARTGAGCSASGSTSCSAASRSNEVIRGIPGSPTNHHGVPYSLTEEFVAVYRMHPLIPDDFAFRSLRRRPRARSSATLPELGALEVRNRLARDADGRPALLVRPRASRAPSRCTTTRGSCSTSTGPTASTIDLAAIDILRVRERGVPRYNEFRRLFHLKPGRRRSRS